MKNSKSSAEKKEARFEKVRAQILALPKLFAQSGHVRSYWKTCSGERTGAYYCAVYQGAGRRHSLYLGNSPQLAAQVTRLLDDLPSHRRDRLGSRKLRAKILAALRQEKAPLESLLELLGFRMKGYAFYRRKSQKME